MEERGGGTWRPPAYSLLCPRPGGIKRWCCLTCVCLTSDVCLSDVCRVHPGGVCGWPAGWRVWLIGPGSAGLAQGCRCALPLQAWAGHMVAAARLHLVVVAMQEEESIKLCRSTRYLWNVMRLADFFLRRT